MAVAVLGGHLYAIGGSDGTTPLNTVERYVGTRSVPLTQYRGCVLENDIIMSSVLYMYMRS